jgi:hypothetical protein
MVEFDKPRCVRIISDVIEAIDMTMEEHPDVVDYESPEEMLEGHAELEADKAALIGLKVQLEMDCE